MITETLAMNGLFAFLAWFVMAYLVASSLSRYKRFFLGFFICLLFGPLGWIACLIIRRDHEREEDHRWHRELVMAVRGEAGEAGEAPDQKRIMTDPQGRRIEMED